MSYIDNVSIDGQVYGTTAPAVSLAPLIRWEYVGDAADIGQVSFEIRVGTSNTDLGNDSFSGDILSSVEISGSNFYTMASLSRGGHYYGQIRSTDSDDDNTEWSTFEFTINSLPIAYDQTITPDLPQSSDDLEVSYSYFDSDGHEQSNTKIRWFKNGRQQNSLDDLCIVPSSMLSPNDSWYARIIPGDGIEYGIPVETASVTIAAVDEDVDITFINNVRILPEEPNIDDILKVEYDLVDNEYFPVTEDVVITWYLNDVEIDNSNQQYIRLDTEVGDEIYVKVALRDANDFSRSTSAVSGTVSIQDVPWYVYNVSIGGYKSNYSLLDLSPVIEWNTHKTKSSDAPSYVRVYVNQTPAIQGSVFDSGVAEYTSNHYKIPSGYLKKGHSYYIHVGVGDSQDIQDECYGTLFVRTSGSSWENYVNNSTGWSIESKFKLVPAGNESAFDNPFDETTQPSEYSSFEEAKSSWEDNVSILADALMGTPVTETTGIETATTGGFTIYREYPIPVKYDGAFSSSAANPYDQGSPLSIAWQSCYDAFVTMKIEKRKELIGLKTQTDINIHDGSYYCSITLSPDEIIFASNDDVTWERPASTLDLTHFHTIRIDGQGTDMSVYLDNTKIIDIDGGFNSPSALKRIEIGQFSHLSDSSILIDYFRYSTDGAKGDNNTVSSGNAFQFLPVVKIDNGSIDYISKDKIVWTPDDTSQSSKIYQWNTTPSYERLQTSNRCFSPINAIFVDKNRNKYIGTANGVTAIYGEKHDPDYTFDTTLTSISQDHFDRISNVSSDRLTLVEKTSIPGWFSIDTTYRTVGDIVSYLDDPYDPYSEVSQYRSQAIHYYSQRTHGHAWFDNVSNEKGWQVSFSLMVDTVEAEDALGADIDHHGFGVYVNDGTRQEVIYFYEDRIRLYHANVYAPLSTTRKRDYVITAKGDNIYIYQKLKTSPVGSYQLIIDGSSLFTKEASATANSRKPKTAYGPDGKQHAVWHDDVNGRSQIMYSYYDQSWSNPESVAASSMFDLRNPDIDVDSDGRVWVAYEDTSFGYSEISVSVLDSAGWNPKTRVTNYKSKKSNPCIKADTFNNIHITWEDTRDGHSSIYWAMFNKQEQYWSSSGQYGEDSVIVQHSDEDPYNGDPYQVQGLTDFYKPRMALSYPYLYVVCEGQNNEDNSSHVILGYRNLDQGIWVSANAPNFDEDGEFTGSGTYFTVNDLERDCHSPVISTTSNNGMSYVIVGWEDSTDAVRQVWGRVYFSNLIPYTDATQITNESSACSSVSVGSCGSDFAIAYISNSRAFITSFITDDMDFSGTTNELDVSAEFSLSNVCIPLSSPEDGFAGVYEFTKDRDAYDVSSVEYPEFSSIGDAIVNYSSNEFVTSSYDVISMIDTKEFAFGDMSENISIKAHWQNISMYFGYDAKPYSISNFNTQTVKAWPDNRINDLFVDTYGNIIAATFGGLVYHNVTTGKSINITDFQGSKINSVVWSGGKWHWYVASDDGIYRSNDAGKTWDHVLSSVSIVSLSKNKNGYIVAGASNGLVYVYSNKEDSFVNTIQSPMIDSVKTVAIDDKNIVWIGNTSGLFRIENFSGTYSNVVKYDISSGMRSSYVNHIEIVNESLRYISTPTGVEKMHGTTFSNINVGTHSIVSNNVYRTKWVDSTNSLWVAATHTLHEIVFRDESHEIIENETVSYNSLELLTEDNVELDVYYAVNKSSNVVASTSQVFINRNKIDFGYSVDKSGEFVSFNCDLLLNDSVEIEISNTLSEIYDFDQLDSEKEIAGEKRTEITKIETTSSGKDIYLSGGDRSEILVDAGLSTVPFTTVLLDTEKPVGCLEKIDTLSRSQVRFKIIANDMYSGIDSYMLSNYANFTSDGETPLEWSPIESYAIHDLGDNANNVLTSLTIPSSVTISGSEYTCGDGTHIGELYFNGTRHLIAVTSNPIVVFKYVESETEWEAIQAISGSGRYVTTLKTIGNNIYITTGTNSGNGDLRKMVDLSGFSIVGQVNTTISRGLCDLDSEVLFGSSSGDIYSYNTSSSVVSVKYESVGESISSIDRYNRTLFVCTIKGSQGHVFSINTETGDILPEFAKSSTTFSSIAVSNKSSQPTDSSVFVACNELSEIYRANIESLMFRKSYSSFDKDIPVIKEIPLSFVDPQDETGDYCVVAAIGNSIFRYNKSWEFLYRHSEDIKDFSFFESINTKSLWIISNTKVSRWTQVTEESTKNVYLRLKDKAGNISETVLSECPKLLDPSQPYSDTNPYVGCCSTYAVKIKDLQDYINENRIIDVTETGSIVYSFDSPTGNPLYSADRIDEESGEYVSEIFNGSSNLISWRSIAWSSSEPNGTSVEVQIRYGSSEDELKASDWSDSLTQSQSGQANIEYVTSQYIQFKVILKSSIRGVSPSLSSVTIRNITGEASHFFTTNFVLPSRPIKGILTSNTIVPVSADIVFGISTRNTSNFSDYQVIEPNTVFNVGYGQYQSNMRIGARLISPTIPSISYDSEDPYETGEYSCVVTFVHDNYDSIGHNYHYRIRFYGDSDRSQLLYSFFSASDKTGWSYDFGDEDTFPSDGVYIASGGSSTISFNALNLVEKDQRWYLIIDSFDGDNYEEISSSYSYLCSECNISNELGLVAQYYKTGLPTLLEVPNFGSYIPDYIVTESKIDFDNSGSEWMTTDGSILEGYSSNFAAKYTGRILITQPGTYVFYLESSDGSKLFINNDEVIDNDGVHDSEEESAAVSLESGFHDIEVHYFSSNSESILSLKWQVPESTSKTVIPESKLYHSVAGDYCDTSNAPKILNFAIMIEMENGEKIKLT